MNLRKWNWPAITLVFMAPFFGELLSGSSPPTEFFNPFGLAIMPALYGCGAVFIRELVKRWQKGWLSIYLLGMAYGIFEEGIVVRSFFDPAWPDLGIMATYGRWIGVNWVWAFGLTLYHATISISLPILITELLYPEKRNRTWCSKRGFILTGILFFSVAFLGPFFGMSYSLLGFLGCLVSMAGLSWIAYRLNPNPAERGLEKKVGRPLTAVVIGFMSIFGFFFIFYGGPALHWPPLLVLTALAVLPMLAFGLLHFQNSAQWNEKQRWALVLGAALPMMLMAVIQEVDNSNRADDTSGMAVVGVATLLFMIGLGISIHKRQRQNS